MSGRQRVKNKLIKHMNHQNIENKANYVLWVKQRMVKEIEMQWKTPARKVEVK